MTFPDDPHARKTDLNSHAEIEALIREEPDPRERARLLVLLQLNAVLVDNVTATRGLADQFKAHRAEFEAHARVEEGLLNRGRGAMWVAIVLSGVIQALVIFQASQALEAIREVSALARGNALAVERISAEVKTWRGSR